MSLSNPRNSESYTRSHFEMLERKVAKEMDDEKSFQNDIKNVEALLKTLDANNGMSPTHQTFLEILRIMHRRLKRLENK